MHFRYPVKLFLSVAAALLLSGAGYVLTTRLLIRSTKIPESASSLSGPSITVVIGKPRQSRQRADANLPQWSEIPSDLKAEVSISTPTAAAPAPVGVKDILGDRLSTPLPTAEVKAPELPPLPVPEQPKVTITAPEPPRTALPKPTLKRPRIPVPDIRAGLVPPELPAVRFDTSTTGKPFALPVDFFPEIEIASP